MPKSLFAALMLALAAPAPALAQTATARVVPAATPAAAPAPPPVLVYLNPDDFLPQLVLAQPPVRHSPAEALEVARSHALIAAASPDRMAQAKWDATHENPTAYSVTIGRDISQLPATMALLKIVTGEASIVTGTTKRTFGRARPYIVDPTIPTCTPLAPDRADDYFSYPSGHSAMGYSVAWVLARLMPGLAPAILSRAVDYALSREICGMHFHSDTEAGHVLATLIADRLLADPRLAGQVAAAKAELAGN